MNTEPTLAHVALRVLAIATEPLATRDIRTRAAHCWGHPLVNERMYDTLVSLERRGAITRVRPAGTTTRHVYWQLRTQTVTAAPEHPQ